MARAWLELARDEGLQTSVSAENGAASGVYHLNALTENAFPSVTDVQDAIAELIGGVDNVGVKLTYHEDPTAGKVRRRLPKCHPFCEFPVAGITSIVGQGSQTSASPVTPIAYRLGQPPYVTASFTHYSSYRFQVEFRKRMYFLKADELIGRSTADYYAVGATTAQTVYYAKEWERFTWRTTVPLADTVSTEYGQMKFRAPGVAAFDGRQFVGTPFMYLKNSAVEVAWYQVPYRYMFDHTVGATTYTSYLSSFVNTVNQNEWWGYAPGTLLYLGATPEPYIPEPTRTLKLPQGLGGLRIATSEALLCNVKLRFIHTRRTAATAPNTSTDEFTQNRNAVGAGHNLQPEYTTRRFYYVSSDAATEAARRPIYESRPFELLFTDPLLVQPGGVVT